MIVFCALFVTQDCSKNPTPACFLLPFHFAAGDTRELDKEKQILLFLSRIFPLFISSLLISRCCSDPPLGGGLKNNMEKQRK